MESLSKSGNIKKMNKQETENDYHLKFESSFYLWSFMFLQ